MPALYWVEAAALRFGGSDWTFATVVAEDPMKGYGAILMALCIGSYVAGLVHHKSHAFWSTMGKMGKQKAV